MLCLVHPTSPVLLHVMSASVSLATQQKLSLGSRRQVASSAWGFTCRHHVATIKISQTFAIWIEQKETSTTTLQVGCLLTTLDQLMSSELLSAHLLRL